MTIYSYEDALAASLSYFNGEELPAKVFIDKYSLRNSEDKLLEKTPEDMHRRIAREFARIEKKKFKDPLSEDFIFSLLDKFKYIIPQGSPMYGIGNKEQYVTLSNCYVLNPPEDSYGGIHYTDEQISHISKRRGGVGIDISNLRPAGAATKNSSRTSTGILSFMERYSNSIREVGQSGRRGACMLTLHVHHPQVLDFVKVKNDLTKVTGANISLKLTDEFLQAVKDDSDYELRFPVRSLDALLNPNYSKMVSARSVWKEIIKNAHAMAEPGLLFWDTIIRNSPADCYADFGFRTVSTNPCSELPLSILDSCRLLLQNLYSYVVNPFSKNAYFNFNLFYQHAKIAQRLMDDLIDLELECIDRIITKINKDPEDEKLKAREREIWETIKRNCIMGRRTGTGVTAVGDTIAACGFKYDSDEGLALTEKIYKALKFACYESSIDMAEELGPFPIFNSELEVNCEFFNRFKQEKLVFGNHFYDGEALMNRMSKSGRRNIALLTTAPAGTVSILTETTSGIEPLFAMWYNRKKKGNLKDENFRCDFTDANGDTWMEFKVYHKRLADWMSVTGESDYTKSPYYGACANDINWERRVKLQALAAQHVDHSISSTINLPNNVSVEEVAKIYETAWETGMIKGMTVYRDGCRDGVLTTTSVKEQAKEISVERPKYVPCEIHHVTVKGNQYFVLIGKLNGEAYELFAGKNGVLDKSYKNGFIQKRRGGHYQLVSDDKKEVLLAPITATCNEEEEAVTRLVSLSLRANTDLNEIVTQLEKVSGGMQSFAKAIARVLKKFIPDGTITSEGCPDCGEPLIRQEGCKSCKNCGYSKCL